MRMITQKRSRYLEREPSVDVLSINVLRVLGMCSRGVEQLVLALPRSICGPITASSAEVRVVGLERPFQFGAVPLSVSHEPPQLEIRRIFAVQDV